MISKPENLAEAHAEIYRLVDLLHRQQQELARLRRMKELLLRVPLDLAGMESAELGGLGALPLQDLWALEAKYRFFFNPIRYTSMGLAVCEAMMLGMPIIGLSSHAMPGDAQRGVPTRQHRPSPGRRGSEPAALQQWRSARATAPPRPAAPVPGRSRVGRSPRNNAPPGGAAGLPPWCAGRSPARRS